MLLDRAPEAQAAGMWMWNDGGDDDVLDEILAMVEAEGKEENGR